MSAAIVSLLVVPVSLAADWPRVQPEDEDYLRGVAADTWACIAHFVEPETGLPFDSSERNDNSSVSNLGYYAASCAVAAELKLVSREEATQRVRRVLDAYRGFKQWNGFSQSWNNAHTLKPASNDTMISLLDSANMVAGFVVAGQLLPDVRADVDEILGAMNWKPFYDPADGRLFGGYDMARGKIDHGWHIGDYAGDGRMAALLAIAVGAAPPESWDKLGRETETHYGLTICKPAWLGGGLFMQVQDGLFLDERSTPAGRSAADFAYVQMLFAKQQGLPAWGWSACCGPDGEYLGWGGLKVAVVTPHAAGMAANFYPHKAADCLRELEKRGLRAVFEEDGKQLKLGFRDSINLDTGATYDGYLPPLDQAMMFLALANALEDRVVQRAFMSHPVVRTGCQRIAEYSKPVDEKWLAELLRRDLELLRVPALAKGNGPTRVAIDDFERPDIGTNLVGGATDCWTRDKADETVSVKLRRDETDIDGTRGGCLRVDYDVDSPNPAYGGLTLNLAHVDGSGCNALRLRARGLPDRTKIELHGRGGSGAVRAHVKDPTQWSTIELRYRDFGLITDWSDLDRLVIVLEDNASKPKVGTVWLDDIELIRE
ncbi:MAG: DUF3131 domain-containing protein [Phycisphaerae bacterium]|nr:DUF3131 domain-containing protein [Phycisphaerae bacterium]